MAFALLRLGSRKHVRDSFSIYFIPYPLVMICLACLIPTFSGLGFIWFSFPILWRGGSMRGRGSVSDMVFRIRWVRGGENERGGGGAVLASIVM